MGATESATEAERRLIDELLVGEFVAEQEADDNKRIAEAWLDWQTREEATPEDESGE